MMKFVNHLYLQEIIRGYNFLKRKAIRKVRKGDATGAVDLVGKIVCVANQLNWMYDDRDLDDLMDRLSGLIIQKQDDSNEPTKGRVVFFDQYGKSFILALQYLNGLVNAGYEVLYILSDHVQSNTSTYILDELAENEHIHMVLIDQNQSIIDRANDIYKSVIEFAPEKVFLHVKAFSVFNIVVPSLSSKTTKYNIDLQDHAMWIKNNQIDYVLPYRVFGATIDIEKRGFKKEQVLLMPYYPIITKHEFQGWPDEVEDKTIIFSGGDLYKTVDKHNSFWTLVVDVLVQNPEAVIVYATKGNPKEYIDKALIGVECKDDVRRRLKFVGFRPDIDKLFEKCDIYLGTSPMSGGLMCQYAAYFGKPILQYYPKELSSNNETEQVINYNGDSEISYTDKGSFLVEAKHLINDSRYRHHKGEINQKSLITREQFNQILETTISRNRTEVSFCKQNIDYTNLKDWWEYLEYIGFSECNSYMRSLLHKRKYVYMPFSTIIGVFYKFHAKERLT